MEQLANNARSSLTGSVDASQLTWTVADASRFPTTGDFRVVCENEYALCTGRSGNVLTVTRGQEGSSGAAHVAGSVVTVELTKAGLEAYIAQSIPSGGGADYEGAWSPATAYVQGDVVNYNGVEYLAVNPSTGSVPPAGTAWIPAGQKGAPSGVATLDANGLVPVTQLPVGIGTAFPSSPFDGQEFILMDSLTVPTYAWKFRYVAAISDAYKWVFVGGSDWIVTATGVETSTTRSTWMDLPTLLRVLVPRAGNYEAMAYAGMSDTISGAQIGQAIVSGAVSPPMNILSYIGGANFNTYGTVLASFSGLAAGADIRVRYASFAGAGTGTFHGRLLAVRPVRVA